uniref:hypothetical protein n=1 Tax=Secundilactobacillus paracollinoides TaxID=240427 RepID=UPI001CDA82D6
MPIKVVAIIGNGLVIQAMIVAIKIANKCQAATLISTGFTGVSDQIPIPKINGRIKPFHLTGLNIRYRLLSLKHASQNSKSLNSISHTYTQRCARLFEFPECIIT